MRKRLIILGLLVGLMVAMLPGMASAKPGGMSPIAGDCQQNYATYGFGNVGKCVSLFAKGGELASVDPELRLVDGLFPCSDDVSGCLVALYGQGLRPGSQVVVSEPPATFGVSYTVDSNGTVTDEGIFQTGICTQRATLDLVARGVAVDGTPIASNTLTVNLLDYLPSC